MEHGGGRTTRGTTIYPLIKSKHDDKSDKYSLKLKLHRDLTSEKSDLYEFKMSLFGNSDPEEFFLFIRYLKMAIKASVMLETVREVQYLRTIVRGEALRQFDSMSADVESANPLTVGDIF